jgi:AraC-like DNA-binding protein
MKQEAIMEGDRPRIPYDNRIFFICVGNGDIILNGERIEIGSNTLIFLGVKDNYYFDGEFQALVINFDMTMDFSEYKTPICPVPEDEYDHALIFDKTEVVGFTSPIILYADESLGNDITLLCDTYIKGGVYSDAFCSAMMKEILADILRAKDETLDSHALLAKRVLLYIKDNAAAIEDNKEIAKRFGYHHVYLGEIFKSQIGMTLHAAITDEKLRIASRMLIYTNSSVEEIATASGFSSRNQFCTVFKKHFGTTPLSYRKKRAIYSI